MTGALADLLARLADPDPGRRPATAAAALADLRALGVPAGAPWRHQPHPPDVVDLLGDLEPPGRGNRPALPAYALLPAACFGAAAVVGMALGWLVVR